MRWRKESGKEGKSVGTLRWRIISWLMQIHGSFNLFRCSWRSHWHTTKATQGSIAQHRTHDQPSFCQRHVCLHICCWKSCGSIAGIECFMRDSSVVIGKLRLQSCVCSDGARAAHLNRMDKHSVFRPLWIEFSKVSEIRALSRACASAKVHIIIQTVEGAGSNFNLFHADAPV